MLSHGISVIVPTKNEEKNIPGFLTSLPEEVILIVVDSSSDRTPELVTQMRPNHTIIIQCSLNIAEARHLGAQAACTPWLVFCDADIHFAPDYFSRLRMHENGEVVYGGKASENEYGWYYRHFVRWQGLFDYFGIPAVSGSNLAMRRDTYMASGGFDCQLKVNEDTELGFRLHRQKYKMRFDPGLLVYTHDQRRLRKGVLRKDLHTILRCALLYFNLMPPAWRTHDLGYWA